MAVHMESRTIRSELETPAMVLPFAEAASMPWYLVAVLFASTSVVVGVIWDISWHQSIGRDSFWTPAHMAIYLGGLAAGSACGWLVLKTTFAGSEEERGRSVRLWGFRAPLGAWVAIWGSFAMLTSAPFDDWWHNAYGLDVEILSPPHVLLALGIVSIQVGALLLALSWQNRSGESGRKMSLGYLYAAGMLIAMVAVMISEYTWANDQHSAQFYRVSAGAFPILLFGVARAGRTRWPATGAAIAYSALVLAMMWILPLFPAQPMLAPIQRPITNMVPPQFPLLLVAPALAVDLLLRLAAARERRNDWLLAALGALAFVAVFWLVQWYSAEFLLSPAARNYVFQGDTWPYTAPPGDWQHEFWLQDVNPAGEFDTGLFARRFALALPIAFVSARVGLWWGNWMSRVKR